MTAKTAHDFDAETGAYDAKKQPKDTPLGEPETPTGERDFDAATGQYVESAAKPARKRGGSNA